MFRAGSIQYVWPSKSCLAENNVKTRLHSDCLTRNGGWALALDEETALHRGRDEGIWSLCIPKQFQPEDPGGGLRRRHCYISGPQKCDTRISNKRSPRNLLETHILWTYSRLDQSILKSPPRSGLKTSEQCDSPWLPPLFLVRKNIW